MQLAKGEMIWETLTNEDYLKIWRSKLLPNRYNKSTCHFGTANKMLNPRRWRYLKVVSDWKESAQKKKKESVQGSKSAFQVVGAGESAH